MLPSARDQALTLATTQNPNVISALFTEDAARDAVVATQAQLLPKLNVVGDFNKSLDTDYRGYRSTTEAMTAQLTIPLYEAGAVYSQTRQAVATVRQRQGQTDDARRGALQGATQAWEAMDAARDNIKSWQESVRAGEVARDSVKIEQKVGARTVLDVLNAEQELFSDRVSLAQAEHDLAVAQFNLAQQIGCLTAADLALPVTLYDVGAHYRGARELWFGFDVEDVPPGPRETPPSGLLDTTMEP